MKVYITLIITIKAYFSHEILLKSVVFGSFNKYIQKDNSSNDAQGTFAV